MKRFLLNLLSNEVYLGDNIFLNYEENNNQTTMEQKEQAVPASCNHNHEPIKALTPDQELKKLYTEFAMWVSNELVQNVFNRHDLDDVDKSASAVYLKTMLGQLKGHKWKIPREQKELMFENMFNNTKK